jgi:hypothetical protein
MKRNANRRSDSRRVYEKPQVTSYTGQELLEMIGPAQGIASGTQRTVMGYPDFEVGSGSRRPGSLSR